MRQQPTLGLSGWSLPGGATPHVCRGWTSCPSQGIADAASWNHSPHAWEPASPIGHFTDGSSTTHANSIKGISNDSIVAQVFQGSRGLAFRLFQLLICFLILAWSAMRSSSFEPIRRRFRGFGGGPFLRLRISISRRTSLKLNTPVFPKPSSGALKSIARAT